MYSNLNILLYHSNVRNKIGKKYDYEFKDLLGYYKKYTKKLFIEFNYKKEKLIQDIDDEYNIKYPHYIKINYDNSFIFDDDDEPYIYNCLLYKVYNEITEEKINKIKSLLYLMIYKNIPQVIVRYCIKPYL